MPLRRQTAVAALLFAFPLAACSDSSDPALPVVAGIVVTGLPDTVGLGDTLRLSAKALGEDGDTLAGLAVRWRSLSPAFVSVTDAGVLIARSVTDARLVVSARGRAVVEDTIAVRVRPLPRRFIFGIIVDSILVGDSATLTVRMEDGFGSPVAANVAWTSSDTAIARVDSTGEVKTFNLGTAWIRASAGGRSDSVRVRGEFRRIMLGRTYVDLGYSSWYRACALTAAGETWCRSNTGTAFRIMGGPPLRTIHSGQSQACGLDAGGTLYCWGLNSSGVFGVPYSLVSRPDTMVAGAPGKRWRQFTLGDHEQACGILAADSVVYCWGHNDTQQTGRAPRGSSDTAVAPHTVPLRAKQVDLSGFHGCAITLDDALWCWGASSAYDTWTSFEVPRQVRPPGSYRHVSTGAYFTCALDLQDAAWCWGDRAIAESASTPRPVAGGLRFARLFTGFRDHACGITAVGDLYCWNVAQGTATAPLVARHVMPGRRFVAAGTSDFMLALSTEGHIYQF